MYQKGYKQKDHKTQNPHLATNSKKYKGRTKKTKKKSFRVHFQKKLHTITCYARGQNTLLDTYIDGLTSSNSWNYNCLKK